MKWVFCHKQQRCKILLLFHAIVYVKLYFITTWSIYLCLCPYLFQAITFQVLSFSEYKIHDLLVILIHMACLICSDPTDLSRPEASLTSIWISESKLILILSKKHSRLWPTSENLSLFSIRGS